MQIREIPSRSEVEDKNIKTVDDGVDGNKYAIKKPNVAAYARVSTKEEEQETSLIAQREYYRKHIKSNPDWNYVGVYAEKVSGLRNDKRTEFLAMVDDCRKGRIDIILCKSPSRFGRNTLEALIALRELKGLGVEVRFDEYSVPFADPKADMYYSVIFSLFQEESRQKSENTKWGLERGMESGECGLYNRPCYGYRKDEETGKLVIYEPEAKIVRKIFNWSKAGKGSTAIVKLLAEEGVKSPKGKPRWSPKTIIELLNNEKYHGDVILGKTYTKDYLSKKRVRNNGEMKRYKVIGNHEKIIEG